MVTGLRQHSLASASRLLRAANTLDLKDVVLLKAMNFYHHSRRIWPVATNPMPFQIAMI
jgi:hypothetical protein